jgi:molecular chaperone HscA
LTNFQQQRNRSEALCSPSDLPVSTRSRQRWDNSHNSFLAGTSPNLNRRPHQRRIAVGIDLGTVRWSLACAMVWPNACLIAKTCDLAQRRAPTWIPTAARFEAALAAQVRPSQLLSSVKRLMGRGIDDIASRSQLPYQFQ